MATNTELVQQLYVAYFNRPADVDSLAYYVALLDNSTDVAATVLQASADFANAAEYQTAYAGLSAKQIINTIYHNLFGREADIPGLNYWANLYTTGQVTLANVVSEVAKGAQTTDATAYNNKVAAAVAFTDAIALSADQQLAYANNSSSLAIAQNYLSGVTDDASLQAALDDIATTAASVIPSVKTSLTVAADTFTGSSGNDVYNALAIDANGAAATTLNAADVIDGGGGTNTVNITVDGTNNALINATFKNIQIFNIDNTTATAAATTDGSVVDATAFGTAAKQIWQISKADDITNLGASTTAGYKNIASASTLTVGAAATASSISVALKSVAEGSTIAATGDKLAAITVSGSLKDLDSPADTSNDAITVAAVIGKELQTFTLTSGVAATLTVDDTASTKKVTTVDLSGSTGAITFVGDTDVTTIKGGSGADTLTLTTTTVVASTGVPGTNATLTAGAGKNVITVATTGGGNTTVTGGDDVDTITINDRGTGKLTVSLGGGADIFKVNTGATAILAGDVIDGGDGTDTLTLQVVGANNIASFVNFEVFDVVGLDHTLDVDILATNNTVSEFVASGAAGGAVTLDNIGAGVGFRVTGDAGVGGGTAITLTQKTAGALALSIDSHETTAATGTGVGANIVASNATSVAVAFKESFVDDASGGGDNIATLVLTTAAATSVTVASGGGSNASNVLQYTDTGSSGKVTSLTITGDTALTLEVAGAAKLATIDSSASTGGLTFAIDPAKELQGAVIKLGSGVDSIDASLAINATLDLFSLTGFEKAAAAAIGNDATAATAAIADADTILITGGAVAADVTGSGDTVTDGVLTFSGAGPTTLADAITAANDAVGTQNATVVFKYLGDTYIFSQGSDNTISADDIVVKLTGVTGVTTLAENGTTDHFFIV